ncbi:MAG: hypothetical protein JNL59_09225 [Chitinophagaceae bacterium]|nr:hypothetical protein [Chitinophagaceae bacterium]
MTFVIVVLIKNADFAGALMKTGILISTLLVLTIAGYTLPATEQCYMQSVGLVDQRNTLHTTIGIETPATRQFAVKVLTTSSQQSATGKAGHKHRKLRQRFQHIPVYAAEPASIMPFVFSYAAVPFTDKHESLLKSADFPPFSPPRFLS